MDQTLFADVGYSSLNKYGEELCGDKVHVARTEDSAVVVLADGLGSGVKANILATLTSKIAGDMLQRGCDIEDVVDTITQTLPVCKVRGVAYSTLTLFQLLADGRAYLVEYDNPPTFFFRNRQLTPLSSEERVVNGKIIKETIFQAEVNDMIVMVSDGAVHAGIGGILNLGWQWNHIADYLQRLVPEQPTPERLAAKLADACNELYCSRPGDDTTVVCVELRRPTPVSLLVGPPNDPNEDERVVADWYAQPGKKVVCGGTSAQIVAKLLNKPLSVDIAAYVDPEVPPIGVMPGIDLVTEGVLTLRKTLAYLQQHAAKSGSAKPDLPNGQDGASLLARMLLSEATRVQFYVGTAINPAHQNPDFPLDLNIKLRIVHEMNRVLQALGKPTSIKLY